MLMKSIKVFMYLHTRLNTESKNKSTICTKVYGTVGVVSFEANTVSHVVKSLLICMFQAHYNNGEYIIRQGARGDTFYIIAKGKVSTDV